MIMSVCVCDHAHIIVRDYHWACVCTSITLIIAYTHRQWIVYNYMCLVTICIHAYTMIVYTHTRWYSHTLTYVHAHTYIHSLSHIQSISYTMITTYNPYRIPSYVLGITYNYTQSISYTIIITYNPYHIIMIICAR